MSPKHIMFMGLICAAGTLISLTFGGLWLGATETEVTNALTVFKQAEILGTWSVAVPNISFFLVGASALMSLDFAFFGGLMGIVQWFLFMTIGLGMLWGIYTVVIGTINGLFRR